MKAAEALGISEYDFFRLAFRRWAGREPADDALEQAFIAYMFRQTVPPWVRHLSRQVLKLHQSGRLDPHGFGVEGFKRRQPLPGLGRLSWRLAAVAIFIVFLMSLDTTYDKNPSLPMGCPGATGSVFFDRLAGIFKTGPVSDCARETDLQTDDLSRSP